MASLIIAAAAFSFSQVLLSLLLLLRNRANWSIQEKLLGLFMLAALSYLINGLTLNSSPQLSQILIYIQTSMPGLFWLFCASLFDDRFKLNYWKITLVAATVLMPIVGDFLLTINLPAPRLLFWTIPQAIEFVLLILAIVVVIRLWRVDLIDQRRNLRLWFCGMTGGYLFTLVLMREILFPNAEWFVLWQYIPVGVICLVTNILLLQYKPGLLDLSSIHKAITELSEPPTDAPHIDEPNANNEQEKLEEVVDVPQQVIADLEALLQEEHIYREMGLTIGALAERLDLQEYRLRKIINTGLGYRNFNDFLNGYRIKEAGERLADPQYASETILNIALDIGFRSLSSFNKAFKEAYGKTPTEYRNNQQND